VLRTKGIMLAAFSHLSKDKGEAKRCSFSKRVRPSCAAPENPCQVENG